MESQQFTTTLFGKTVSFAYSDKALGYVILTLRLIMGYVMLSAGLEKLLSGNWTAAGYLSHLPAGNPFIPIFAPMAGSGLVNFLVIWGEILIGIALIIGIAVRFASFWGAIMLLLFWATSLTGGLLAGLPLANGFVVDDHLVYALLFWGLGAFGAGRVLGVDGWLHSTGFVQRHPWIEWLLG